MSELNKLDRMIDLTKDNINQLLWIGIHNNDGNIKEVYGGEKEVCLNLSKAILHFLKICKVLRLELKSRRLTMDWSDYEVW